MRTVKLQLTPITDSTFERQGWKKHSVEGFTNMDGFDENDDIKDDESDDVEGDTPYFWTLSIPKERNDVYAPKLVSSASDQTEELTYLGLKPGQYFLEILDFDGLGFCTTEEELEILYKALTGKVIEE